MVGEDGLEILDSDLAATPGEQLHGPVRADERIRNRGSEEVLDLMPEFDEMIGVRQYSFFRVHHSDIVGGNLQVNHFAILVRNHHVARERSLCFERSEEHTSELQSRSDLVCRLLLEKKKT